MKNKLIAITGGIGCGKSVVSTLLRVMGYEVYDCDQAAKRLMTEDPELCDGLRRLFGPETYLNDGSLNKPHLSASIFGNAEALAQMNALVHPAVGRDLLKKQREYIERHAHQPLPYFFESAILFESGFDRLVPPDEIWCVTAPLELRIERAMLRDHAPRERIVARIDSQMSQEEKEKRSDHLIVNDSEHSVIEQVNELIKG